MCIVHVGYSFFKTCVVFQRLRLSMARPSSNGSGIELPEDDQFVTLPTVTELLGNDIQWERLVRKMFRIRRLQRIWGNLGQHLQQFGGDLRRDLRNQMKKSTT